MEEGSNGDGDESGGTSPSRQGAGAASPGSPDLETAAAANREGFVKKGSCLGVSTPRGKYRRRGRRGATQGSQEGTRRGLGWGRARDPSGSLVVAPLPSFGYFGSFPYADFLYKFSGIFWAL